MLSAQRSLRGWVAPMVGSLWRELPLGRHLAKLSAVPAFITNHCEIVFFVGLSYRSDLIF